MKKVFVMLIAGALFYACSDGSNDNAANKQDAGNATTANGNPSYDPKRGEGKFTHVEVSSNLDVAKADAGNKVYEVKCSACHKLSAEKLVGPGWNGLTKKLTPEWIMNFITNPDAMLDKDPEAQAQLEICLVRMPNQNLSDDDARNIFEFMRKNDGVK
jgi:mono/diheme cytochrome c family protein